MRFIIETINSQQMRRFIVESIFVNSYRQYGNCRRTQRQTENSQNSCQTIGEFESEIEGAPDVAGIKPLIILNN